MLYLLLSILSSTAIAVIFKIRDKINIPLLPVIVINYLTATMLGFGLTEIDISVKEISESEWLFSGILIGILLIAGFWLIGFSTQKVGIAITTVSSKMSVALPILFSVLFFSEDIHTKKIIGIIIALSAIAFSVFKKKKQKTDIQLIWLPVLLFLAIGIIDSAIKYSQTKLSEDHLPVFTMFTFGIAFITGIFTAFLSKETTRSYFKLKVIFTGILLGSANFGSMYFLILALEKSGLESSVVFGINNVSIISLSAIIALMIFGEKPKPLNWLGIFLSLIAVLLLGNLI